MLSGPLTRNRKSQKKYKSYLAGKPAGCDFCEFRSGQPAVREEYEHFWLVTNTFGYDVWDSMGVSEHLMLVPKLHVESLSHFSVKASRQYLQLIARYEDAGYSIYCRAVQNISKSVAHQHTHLIKLDNKRKKALLFVHKPHMVLHV